MDPFLEDKVVWIATVTDGEAVWDVYQDDHRPGLEEWSAWRRLQTLVKERNLKIVKIRLQFFDHVVDAGPENCAAYFFCYGVAAVGLVGIDYLFHYYITGYVIEDKLYVQRWAIPELVLDYEEVRPFDPSDERLIING